MLEGDNVLSTYSIILRHLLARVTNEFINPCITCGQLGHTFEKKRTYLIESKMLRRTNILGQNILTMTYVGVEICESSINLCRTREFCTCANCLPYCHQHIVCTLTPFLLKICVLNQRQDYIVLTRTLRERDQPSFRFLECFIIVNCNNA